MLLMQACQGHIKINCLLVFYLREWMFFFSSLVHAIYMHASADETESIYFKG